MIVMMNPMTPIDKAARLVFIIIASFICVAPIIGLILEALQLDATYGSGLKCLAISRDY